MKIDKLHTGKLETTLFDVSKLNDAVNNDVVKKTEYDRSF